jgi:hypothetical protein
MGNSPLRRLIFNIIPAQMDAMLKSRNKVGNSSLKIAIIMILGNICSPNQAPTTTPARDGPSAPAIALGTTRPRQKRVNQVLPELTWHL